jgi:transcriptional regulator with XRE-family HTH domain
MPTPAISAVAAEPPKTSTSSSTERGIGIDNSRHMKTSRAIADIHVPAVESSPDVKCAMSVGTRDEIIARLRRLPKILGKSDADLARICGVAASTWSNYKSQAASKNIIIWEAALELWNVYGIPMEWVYDGQVGRVPDPDLREKLALANRAAETEAVTRRIRRHSKRH